MKLPRKTSVLLLWIGLPLLVLVVAFGGGLIFRGEYATEQTAQRSFTIDEDFTKVRKIMVRTDAAKQIVTMGGDSKFVQQQWTEGSVGLAGKTVAEALLKNVLSNHPDWEIKLHGALTVQSLDPYIGQPIVKLQQDVHIDPDEIRSEVQLKEGARRLLGYAMTTRLWRDANNGGRTRVELKLRQKILTDAPWFAHGIADRRVQASAEAALANQEQALRRLIQENADKAGLFPLR